MNIDDIIRRFLDLHPETPFDMTEYAIPLLTIRHLVGAIAAAEREECAKVCEKRADRYIKTKGYMFSVGAQDCAEKIRERGSSDSN